MAPTASAASAAIAVSLLGVCIIVAEDAGGADVFQLHLGGALAIDGAIAAAGKAGGGGIHQEHADAAVVALPARGARGHHQLARGIAVQDHPLAPGQPPAAAIPLRRRRHVEQVVAGLPFGMGEGEPQLPGSDRRHQCSTFSCRRTVAEKAEIIQQVKDLIWPALADGRLKPATDRVFALTDAEKALKYLQERLHLGKILLEVGPN